MFMVLRDSPACLRSGELRLRASADVEKAVCADAKLGKLDENVSATFKAMRAQLSAQAAAEIQADQRAWLAWLPKVCPLTPFKTQADLADCLSREYDDQFAMLKNGNVRTGGLHIFPRLHVLMALDTTPPSPGSADAGFGKGRFSWPEIDRPTPEQAAWNEAARAEVVWYSTGAPRREQKVFHFDDRSVADEDAGTSWSLTAANPRFVSVAFRNRTYEHGAAHGDAGSVLFAWWLDRGRKLRVEDVFRPGSGWEAFLGTAAFAKLKRERGAELFQDDSAASGAADTVKDVEAWPLDRNGLTVIFGQYSVGPYSSGEFSTRFSWDELRPYLADELHPESLPAAGNL